MALVAMVVMASCGSSEHEYTAQEKILVSHIWAADVNADIKAGTDAMKEETGISADGFQLKGDVAKIGDFLAEKYQFGKGENDPSQLVYCIRTGEGFFSAVTEAGLWKMSADGKTLEMAVWDDEAGDYSKEWVKCEIIELSDTKLVWKKDGDVTNSYFVPAE